MGETLAKVLALNFGSIDALMQANEERLLEINEVGPEIAKERS